MHERAALLFGFQNFTISRPVPLEMEALKRAAVAAARRPRCENLSVSRRGALTSASSLNSMEIDRIVGAEVAAAHDLKVDLNNPELTITIEILPDIAFMAVGKHPGAGRTAGGSQRTCDGAALGRHRLAGGGLSHDAARLARATSSISTAIRWSRRRAARRRSISPRT